MTRERFSSDKCQGIQLLDYKSFFPVGWMNEVGTQKCSNKTMRFFNLIKIFQKLFWNPRRRQSEWYSMLNESYGVHFYSSMKNSEIVKFPEFYGDNIPAYLAIALDHCPVSYWSKNDEF